MNAIHELDSPKLFDSLRNLVETVPFLHHQVLRQKLAAANRNIQRIAQNHVVPLPVMDRLERRFLVFADQLETNLEEQECWLFAWLGRLVDRGAAIHQPSYLEESLEEAMDQAAAANQEALDGLGQIETDLCMPDWTDKGLQVEELIDHVHDLEEELTEYHHLEREELFPRVREICRSSAKEEEVNHAY